MSSFSYYDKIDTILGNKSMNDDSQEKYSLSHLSQKIKEDMPKLERFIKDDKYRKKLENSLYPRYNPELFDILGLENLVKQKIGIPENATIKYEKVKCSRDCIHNHEYFYAYYWNPITKKLRKKYIGKELPEPFKFTITYSME